MSGRIIVISLTALSCVLILSEAFTIISHWGTRTRMISKHDDRSIEKTCSFAVVPISSSAAAPPVTDDNDDPPDLNPHGVERVSICMGELCKCQSEENAESIMDDLLSRNLPYVVEDAPCLGACGVGSMVSIEYEDGGYDLVTGLQETYDAVGISPSSRDEPESSRILDSKSDDDKASSKKKNSSDSFLKIPDRSEDDARDETLASTNQIIQSSVVKNKEREPEDTPTVKEQDHGAVERMRNEAEAASEGIPNPWINMAMYLAQKAKDNILK